jgi:hypothetical protein
MPVDRYPANPLDGPSGLAEKLRELERRLTELEAARPLGNTTISQGTLRVVDSNGDLRVQIGEMVGAGGTGDVWGIEVVNQPGTADWPNGEPFFRASDDGAEFPYQSLPMVDESLVSSVTSGSFVATWTAATGILMHRYASALVWVTTPVGTTGEIRLTSGAAESDAVTIPSNTNTYVSIPAFAHGLSIWTGPHYFDIEARRTSGAGNVDVHQPALGLVLQPR